MTKDKLWFCEILTKYPSPSTFLDYKELHFFLIVYFKGEMKSETICGHQGVGRLVLVFKCHMADWSRALLILSMSQFLLSLKM